LNADGTLDTTYGSNGYVQTPVSGYGYDSPFALTIQPSDGKAVGVGAVSNGGQGDLVVVRFNIDGSLDQSFGSGGIAVNNISSGYDYTYAVALQSDGKIVTSGSTSGQAFVARYNTDGSLDTSFGSNGLVTDSFGGSDTAFDVAIQSDGKIVATGADSNGNGTMFVIRYNSNGSHDTSFASNGIYTASAPAGAVGLVIQSDGKIVLGGWVRNAYLSWAMSRLNSDGTLDTSFGNNGLVVTDFGSGNYSILQMSQYNGMLIVTSANPASPYNWILGRYVNNAPPVVGSITAPSSPVLVNTAITASANFTDADTSDTHTASWNWGDGSTPTTCPPNTTGCTLTESNGSGSVSASHTYTATGVYTITLTVTDNKGGQGTSTFQYVSVYDSTSSFAGGRSYDNPSSASPSTTGKVSFGVSAKYNNSNVLTGNAKMDFKAASLDFVSTSLSSLATSNGKAYLKGAGTLNGNSGYTFLATGIDGSVAGGNDLIRFQIKDSSNNVVYDSQPGAGDTADPTTTDVTGNIRVH
jgi:uncharacterized delta-60 repeat protein